MTGAEDSCWFPWGRLVTLTNDDVEKESTHGACCIRPLVTGGITVS